VSVLTGVLLPVVLLLNGLAAGVLLGSQMGGFALLVSLPADRYVQAHAFLATRYDPFMPACLLGTTVGALALAVVQDRAELRAVFAAAGLCALATVLIAVTRNVPINTWVRSLDPDRLPADLDLEPRRRWGFWNGVRAYLTVAALVLDCLGAGLVI
jgi:uncharacterized membrane protein